MDVVGAAQAVVSSRYPGARAALLGGSARTARRTATSDLDIVVVVDGEPAPMRETTEHAGVLVELFVHTPDTLRSYWEDGVAERRPALIRMCAESLVVVSKDGASERLQAEAAALLAAGPRPLSEEEWRRRRYALTDLLDDLAGPPHPTELVFLVNLAVTQVAEMTLLAAQRWVGTGKWLARELEQLDAAFLDRVVVAHRAAITGDSEPLMTLADEVLAGVGGRLSVGYQAKGQLPAR